ncbi:MAG: hypothetical protein LH606_06090 [Cytophagaceae bacterium]|nr:hypothetical protein [Cytophagaceae bacterium]
MLTQVAKSPFKFLDAYTAQDKAMFFGRETEQKRLVELISRSRLILVYGASGTGKSSLVQCGLAQALSDTDYFPVIVRRRGGLPTTLLSTLRSIFDEDDLPDTSDVVELVTHLSQYSMRPVYLIFDQFEELFISGNRDEQQLVFATIQALCQAQTSCKLLLVMREDYIPYLYPYEERLPGLLDFRLRVERMSEGNVHEVIVQTCRHTEGIRLDNEAETVRQILENIQDARNTFQLPYLQVYLDRLWRTAHENQPDRTGEVVFDPALVERVGAIEDVLEQFLNEQKKALSNQLTTEEQPALGQLLEGFVTYEGTRREQRLDALQTMTGLQPTRLQFLLSQLERSRLLRHEEGTYELAHDSLARVIDKNRSTEQRQINDILRRLKEAYQEFKEKPASDELWLPPRRLTEIGLYPEAIRAELARSVPDSTAVWKFVTDSQHHHDRLQRQELDKQQQRNRQLRLTVLGVSALLVLALISMVFALRQWGDSNVKSVVFQTREMDPLHALVMTAWAYEREKNPITSNAFYNTFYNQQPYEHRLQAPDPIIHAVFSPDGQVILTTTKNQQILVWDGAGKTLLDSLSLDKTLLALDGSSDFRVLLVFTTNGEMYLWNRQQHRMSPLLRDETIAFAGVSPDGQTILAATQDGQLFWMNRAGQLVERLVPDSAPVSAQYAPDGKTIGMVHENGSVSLWNTKTRRIINSLQVEGEVQNLAFFANGQQILITTSQGRVYRWNRLNPRAEPLPISAQITLAEPATNGKTILVSTEDFIYFFDSNGILLDSLKNKDFRESLSFSPDGQSFFSVVDNTQIEVSDRKGAVSSQFFHNSPVQSASFSPDGRRVLTLTTNGHAYLWNRHDPRSALLPHRTPVELVIPSPDGQTVATSIGQTLYLWNQQGACVDSFSYDAPITSGQFSPDGRTVFTTHDGPAQRWHPGDKRSQKLPFPASVNALFASPDGRFMVANTPAGAYWWRLNQPQPVALPGKPDITSVVFSPDGQMALYVTADGKTYFWRDDTRKPQKSPLPESVNSATFSPDGQTILATTQFSDLWLLNREGTLSDKQPPSVSLSTVLFSPNAQALSVGGFEGSMAYLWDLKAEQWISLPHRTDIQAIAFSPDGQTFLVRTEQQVHLWDRLGQPVMATERGYSYAGFSSDGRLLITLRGENVRLWPSPNHLVTWLHKTYSDSTLKAVRQEVKKRYGIHTSFWEALSF